MKIEIDTINDSVDELKKTIALLQEALERKTGITGAGIKAPLRPHEFPKEEPKIIFQDILGTPSKKLSPSQIQVPAEKEKIVLKKRKVLRQDEKAPDTEEEDEDRHLPQIQIRDYW
jgi:hypothetical protein